ncbi:Cysteine-rich receptor-like protein kinase 11 [Forsythia ovata]|uniref:Cysteine-rich receptor-like protein kinase 11 n=1 Tax=Forsythia ovata TaxID=205694 RepID=A0ABD1WE66_9LAMI
MTTGKQDLYLKVSNSDLPDTAGKRKILEVVVAVLVPLVVLVSGGFIGCFYRRKIKQKGNKRSGQDLLSFDFNYSDDFSSETKLGEGGFGPVYKGKLLNGQEIAVKRLSQRSAQGFEEFRNEIVLIAKLQHRNLVRLLGYSVDRDESILIYEYLPNKSLDFFLFG